MRKVKVYYMLDNNGALLTSPVKDEMRKAIIQVGGFVVQKVHYLIFSYTHII